MPSPNLMAAALTRRTSHARIMVLGNAIAIRGNPLRVAEEIAMLDLGRAGGWTPGSCAASAGSTSGIRSTR